LENPVLGVGWFAQAFGRLSRKLLRSLAACLQIESSCRFTCLQALSLVAYPEVSSASAELDLPLQNSQSTHQRPSNARTSHYPLVSWVQLEYSLFDEKNWPKRSKISLQ